MYNYDNYEYTTTKCVRVAGGGIIQSSSLMIHNEERGRDVLLGRRILGEEEDEERDKRSLMKEMRKKRKTREIETVYLGERSREKGYE